MLRLVPHVVHFRLGRWHRCFVESMTKGQRCFLGKGFLHASGFNEPFDLGLLEQEDSVTCAVHLDAQEVLALSYIGHCEES